MCGQEGVYYCGWYATGAAMTAMMMLPEPDVETGAALVAGSMTVPKEQGPTKMSIFSIQVVIWLCHIKLTEWC